MNIALLCSGPSLAGYLAERPRHDVTIGVNRAACATACDWWAFNDMQTFNTLDPVGLPKCFTSNACFGKLPPDKRDRFDWLFYGQTATTCPASPGWTSFSVTVGMVLAEHLGARRLTLYGVDQHGAADWDGPSPVPVTRHQERWNRELHRFDHVAAWLRSRQVEVIHTRKGVDYVNV